MPLAFFREHFLDAYMEASSDKVSHVRREFAAALLIIKPYFERDVDLTFTLVETMTALANDADQDVAEAAEQTDYALLQRRKHKKVSEQDDAKRASFQALLIQRGKQEDEERKKKSEEEEENKYDGGANLTDTRKWKPKTKQFNYARRPTGMLRLPGGLGLDKPLGARIPLSRIATSELREGGVSIKRKMVTKKATTNDIDVKTRKASMLVSQKEKED